MANFITLHLERYDGAEPNDLIRIINADFIAEIRHNGTGSYIKMRDGSGLVVAESPDFILPRVTS